MDDPSVGNPIESFNYYKDVLIFMDVTSQLHVK